MQTNVSVKIYLTLLLATCAMAPALTAEEPQNPSPEVPVAIAVAEPAKPVTEPAKPAASTNVPGFQFNAENKQIAKKIYGIINEIQRTGFDPQKNFSLIAELQRVIAGTHFAGLKEIQGYIKASLTLNSLRSRDSKTEQGNTGTQEAVSQKSRGLNADLIFTAPAPVIGGNLSSADSTKVGGTNSSGVTISSQAAFADLGPAMQQQSAAYGKLLEELNATGFPEPVLASQLYGKWRWHCATVAATYEFELQEDGSLYADVVADDPTPPSATHPTPAANRGRGEWKLDYRSITLELHGNKLALFWKQSPQTFLASKQIKSIDNEEIILDADQDNLLKRVRTARRK
ncbi:MAG: hypothetical protein WCP06_03345 [Verrucomicrobiota bacterium]